MFSIDEINEKALKKFEDIGYPDSSNEFWKYTNLKKFKTLDFIKPNYNSYDKNHTFNFELNIPTITIYNGKIMSYPDNKNCVLLKDKLKNCSDSFYNSIFSHKEKEIENNPFLILNNANFKNGIYINLNSNMNQLKIRIISSNNSNDYASSYNKVIIDAEKGTNSSVYIQNTFLDENSKYYKNNTLDINLKESSSISLINLFDESNESFCMNNISINQESNSNINMKSFFLNSGFIRTNIINNLNKPNAYSNLDGLFIGKENEFIDNNLIINHNTKHTFSNVMYKGILDGKSNAVFNGLVNVPKDSFQINSDQKNHNIILSETAKINSNPKLKISCDDVKCAHGSTIGNLDEEELFYLRSRGITLNKSRQILLKSFINEIIDDISDVNCKNFINNKVENIFYE
tara:strand:- start:2638 stop:3846 length:1209 start_codon:yes stop_codon:yes gene_type:complete